MKYSFITIAGVITFIGMLSGCDGPDHLACTTTQTANGAIISCPDGSTSTLSNGSSGAQGLGSGIFSSAIPAGDSRCNQGNGGFEYTTFTDPNDTGVYDSSIDTITSQNYVCNGANGDTGPAGASSSVSLVPSTAAECPSGGWDLGIITAGQSSPTYSICNGSNAPTSPLTMMQFIAPCGLGSSAWKEELILFSDGTLLADFSDDANGRNTRLSFIPDGSYIDTDDSGCEFSISTNGNSRTISWAAGSSPAEPNGWSAGGWSWTMPVAASGATPIN